MRKIRWLINIACFLMLLFASGYAAASASDLSLPMFSEYYISTGRDGKYSFGGIDFEIWKNTANLDGKIRSVAISKNGNVGILSSTSLNNGFPNTICVFTNNGEFIYGYQFSVKDKRGYDFIFFNERSELCYYVTRNTSQTLAEKGIFVLEQNGAGVREYYTLPSIHILEDKGIYISNMSNSAASVFISPESKFTVSILEDAKLAIREIGTKEDITIYNQEEPFMIRQKKMERRRILESIGLMFLFIVIVLLLTGLARIRDRDEE